MKSTQKQNPNGLKTMEKPIRDIQDLQNMLDQLFRSLGPWWDNFYEDRNKNIPFFVDAPDENLVSYFDRNILMPGRVLELGAGSGRNAIYMTEQGCKVDAVDLSAKAIEWGKERANVNNLMINFIVQDVFSLLLKMTPMTLFMTQGYCIISLLIEDFNT
jgi:2-polyprenyl-3-methyl-5-hydroxy-6-metoxy-1,4-benzoquinol methylase